MFGVEEMCRVLCVSRSGYYAWRNRKQSKRAREDRLLLKLIREVFEESDHIYGSPRITETLQSRGVRCGKNRIARLMRENAIVSKIHRRFKVTTNSNHKRPVAENLVDQDFQAAMSNELWTSDITYIRTDEGWLYLAVILALPVIMWVKPLASYQDHRGESKLRT